MAVPVTVRPKKPMAMKTKVMKTDRKMMPKCTRSAKEAHSVRVTTARRGCSEKVLNKRSRMQKG